MARMTTGIIRYNLKDRMRQYNGQERNFDIPKLVDAINSPKVQERVRLGDLNGFYGHWPRITFGAEPQEGGVVDGKVVNLEPCCRTIYLKAYPDGTVEHEQEFFPNDAGEKAYAQLQAKSGGFSSVISGTNGYIFHGFDFVREPNFSGNRPYLDASGQNGEQICEILVLDDTNELKADDNTAYLSFLLDSIQLLKEENRQLRYDNAQLTESLGHLNEQQEILLDDIVFVKRELVEKQQQPKFDTATLDSAIAQAAAFKTAQLEKTEEEIKADEAARRDATFDDWYAGWQ